MPEDKKRMLTLGGVTVEVVQVEIVNRRNEQPNEYELEDGSVIRVVNPTVVVYRVEGQKDFEGHPTCPWPFDQVMREDFFPNVFRSA